MLAYVQAWWLLTCRIYLVAPIPLFAAATLLWVLVELPRLTLFDLLPLPGFIAVFLIVVGTPTIFVFGLIATILVATLPKAATPWRDRMVGLILGAALGITFPFGFRYLSPLAMMHTDRTSLARPGSSRQAIPSEWGSNFMIISVFSGAFVGATLPTEKSRLMMTISKRKPRGL